ncbi:hypothetical protein [Anabaena sp. UHCC 0399]|uniref:hypothetical protein n=1 Tax=Anabaena sp. UHCC 0399 TaxID=3110238 RepID=UPI002B2193D0|nr:hypothetical protein [Anabaena sp. UHCC 0399]MEA5568610.1 hypothetical protein [Anabaena sp. UHCC 0399]
MNYYEQLHPWCIIRVLSNKQQLDNTGVSSPVDNLAKKNQKAIVVARFRRRDDAVAYSQVLNNSIKDVDFAIIFDVQGVQNSSKKDALS